MSNVKELRKLITQHAETLSLQMPDLSNMNHDELTALFNEVEKQVNEVEKVPVKKHPPFRIADGKSITSLRGILAEGVEIKAEDLKDPKELRNLVNKGFVVER